MDLWLKESGAHTLNPNLPCSNIDKVFVNKPITKERALELLPKYSFGKGFYNLSFCRDSRVIPSGSSNCTITEPYGDVVLMFNELSENDMW